MMKVLITSRSFGKIGDSAKNILEGAGIEITNISANFDQAEFERIIPEFDALIIGAHDFSEAPEAHSGDRCGWREPRKLRRFYPCRRSGRGCGRQSGQPPVCKGRSL